MADFADIRAGLAANLATLNDPGITIGDSLIPIQVLPYALDDPSPPTVMVVGIEETDYIIAMQSGGASARVIVQAFAGDTTDTGPQILLDTMLFGATAVKTLIETDRTLGGACEDLIVTRMSGHKIFTPAGSHKRVLGAEWIVQIELTDS